MNESLGLRWKACIEFGWRPGMRYGVKSPYHVSGWCFSRVSAPDEESNNPLPEDVGEDAIPDLDDPATRGVLLDDVRRVWKCPDAFAAPTREKDGERGWKMEAWDPEHLINVVGPCPTEEGLLVLALVGRQDLERLWTERKMEEAKSNDVPGAIRTFLSTFDNGLKKMATQKAPPLPRMVHDLKSSALGWDPDRPPEKKS